MDYKFVILHKSTQDFLRNSDGGRRNTRKKADLWERISFSFIFVTFYISSRRFPCIRLPTYDQYRQVSLIYRGAFALAISEVTHEWKRISIASSIYEAAPNHCMDYSKCEHNKGCTGHVTLPCLRCDHVIPEINTRVTLSHERRAGEVTRWSQTDRKKRRIRVDTNVFSKTETECRGPTLGHDRHRCSPPTVHSVDQSVSSRSRKIGAGSHCLPRKFSSSSSQITSTLSTNRH